MGSAAGVLALGVIVASSSAAAQTRVGEVLDAGGARVSAEQFRRDVVQRLLVGVLDGGISAEIVFTAGGGLEGAGSTGRGVAAEGMQVRGRWSIGQNDTVCTTIVLDGPTIRANYPARCQHWFRLGERYYAAESADRGARVLARTVKE